MNYSLNMNINSSAKSQRSCLSTDLLISSSSYDMSRLLYVFVLVQYVSPANCNLYKTYGSLEFISPGSQASLSGAQAWCKDHGTTLAEITSERIWKLILGFVQEFGLNTGYMILNAEGKELPGWQWINGETFTDSDSKLVMSGTAMYARMSKTYFGNVVITNRSSDCTPFCYNIGCLCQHSGDCKALSPDSISFDGNCYFSHHHHT